MQTHVQEKQGQDNMNIRDYKDKYVFLKDIYNNIKKDIKVKGTRRKRQLSYTEYRKIVSSYFDEIISSVARERDKCRLPNKLGTLYVKKCRNKRPFHIRVDIAESERQGEVVKYKVPILDAYYNKLVWLRPKKLKKCKVLPLYKFKKVIKEVKEY
jgi:nucleoid DNA-binding protein